MTSPSGTVLHVGALITSMSLSFGVGLAIWWAASRYQARMHLRSRVVALSSAAHIVETWEEVCLREVEDWLTECPSSADSKLRNLLFGNGDGGCTTPGKRAPPFHGSLRSLAYAPGVDLNSWMRLWRVGRYLCAALPDDLMLLERLGYIIKYTAFRRLAVMAEARYYSAAWRYTVGDGNGGGGEACSRIPCLPPWLVGRRPFWIVPLPGRGIGRFLCLPLSYFPIEAILTCTAEETWIKELVELSPLLTGETSFKYLFDSLSTWRALRETRSLMQRRYSLPWQQLWNEIDHLFITHAVPLAKSQLERGKIMCRRFYREKLLEGVELTSGEAIDMDEGNCGPLSVPETGSVGTISGRDTLLRDPRISRRVVLLLRLRTLSHTARVVMNLCASRYYVFIERMLFYLLSSSGSGMEQGVILSDFMRRALWGALAAAVEAALQSLDDAIRSEILMILREELVYEINVKLSTADEAFLRRLVEEGTGDRGKNPLERSMEYAESAASQILAYFDCEQRRYISLFFGLLSAVLRQEIDVAVFSATVSVSNCYKLSQTVGRWLGVIPNRAIRLELAQMEEESLPVEPRYGLQLMMNVLAEEMGEGVAGVLPSQEQLHQGGGKVAKPRYFISLVVCGGTFHLGHPVSFCPQGTINLSSRWTHLNRLRRLFDTVVEEGGVCAWPWSAFRFSRAADSCSLAKSLRQNAACVREFVLKEIIKYAPLEMHTAHSG
uniref:Putative ABC transporter n=1 Tax=Trypanosoma congolense (strain IL3000) TaxID=1068625 RepID=G0UJL3_TRYCI|nr:putative ABC transporter [Trypanosoma congolense IL3000]